ncbi:MAG: methionine--tRNA ligase [Elusimicrobia bacterium]|nr:methionine--tRNA ligase [Elusimicrobiota bacterium]
MRYITTPIYYVNANPHIGHAYTQIAADVYSRYHRLMGRQVYFLTGTDEHGEKIARAAAEQGKTPKEFVDMGAENFKMLWKTHNIENDQFVRTTDPEHKESVKEIVRRLISGGYVYKGVYEGLYCVSCETYFTETQVEEKLCPDCGKNLEKLGQESYFFKLSAFSEKLIKHIEENPQFIMPKSIRNEIIGFLQQELIDLSISRQDVSWGVSFPADDSHTVYVWFDALINYISAIGYPHDMARFGEVWPAKIHLIGKDILKFHAVIWPAMLMALDLKLPETVYAHGWWMIEGGKMSKTAGNSVDPLELIEEWGIDPFRYFLMRQVCFGEDGNYSLEQFISRYESDLANDLGNLLSRVVSMLIKYQPEYDLSDSLELESKLKELATELDALYDDMKFNLILEKIWELVREANVYVESSAPWRLAKEDPATLNLVMTNLYETLSALAWFIYPFMPETSQRMNKDLGLSKDYESGEFSWPSGGDFSGVSKGAVLFPKKQ